MYIVAVVTCDINIDFGNLVVDIYIIILYSSLFIVKSVTYLYNVHHVRLCIFIIIDLNNIYYIYCDGTY